MNLNEECLLQFLQSDSPVLLSRQTQAPLNQFETTPQSLRVATTPPGLVGDLQRILRRDRFVSFPPAILIRRPEGTSQTE